MRRAPLVAPLLLVVAGAAPAARYVEAGVPFDVAGDAFGSATRSVRGPEHRLDAASGFHVAAAKAPGRPVATVLIVVVARTVAKGAPLGALPVATYRGGVRAPTSVQRTLRGCTRTRCGYRDMVAIALSPPALAKHAAANIVALTLSGRPGPVRRITVPLIEITAAQRLAARLAG